MNETQGTHHFAHKLSRALVTAALLVAASAPALAQSSTPPEIKPPAEVKPPEEKKPVAEVKPAGLNTILIRGFVNAVAFTQDASFGFGNGGNAAWVTSAPDAGGWITSGDVRASRIALDFRGPPIGGGWNANGTLELDFFGGFIGSGATTDEQPVPRLRTAFADLTRGGTTFRVGQFWNPLFGYVPATVTQLAFPPGIGSAGLIGWRFPGIFVYQNLTGAQAPVRAQLQLAALRGSWDGPGPNLDHMSAGEASGFPQVQGRLDLSGRTGGTTWGAYLVGHYDQKNMLPYGTQRAEGEPKETIEGTAVQAGLRVVPGPLTLHGNAYRGRAIGQNLGHITQFGDIGGWGGWAQAGYAITPSISGWFFYGMDNPDDDDIHAIIPAPADQAGQRLRQARTQNQRYTAMVRYTSGPYQIGLEWMRAETDWAMRRFGVEGISSQTRSGNQMALGVVYSF
jgi:hypothetical protein